MHIRRVALATLLLGVSAVAVRADVMAPHHPARRPQV